MASASGHFRRSKLVRFIKTQEQVIRSTVANMKLLGMETHAFSEQQRAILENLKIEFSITAEEMDVKPSCPKCLGEESPHSVEKEDDGSWKCNECWTTWKL